MTKSHAACINAPRKIPNTDTDGLCDNCGADLGKFVWIFFESTGCTKRCAVEDQERDARDFDEAFGGT